MKTSINETTLLEQKDVREQMIERLEVLDKVKKLFLIPELEVMTASQVSEYYGVSLELLRKCYSRNKIEIDNDGTSVKSYKEFLTGHNVTLENTKGKAIIHINDNLILEIPNRGIRCFSKRAILRIGMLLQDSIIAQEVRTQLLNILEHSTEQQRTHEINEEQKLLYNIAIAYGTHDPDEILKACSLHSGYQKRYIDKLEMEKSELQDDNKALAGETLRWDERPALNSAIRTLATKINIPFGVIWNEFYKELRYKHGIALTSRGGSPYIKHIKEDEWILAIQSFSALCENYGVSPSRIIEKAKLS